MDRELDIPFASIENAQDYLRLLVDSVAEARRNVQDDLLTQLDAESPRRLQALRLVVYNLEKLEQHLTASRRMLNDLRTLRRLLLQERTQAAEATPDLDSVT